MFVYYIGYDSCIKIYKEKMILLVSSNLHIEYMYGVCSCVAIYIYVIHCKCFLIVCRSVRSHLFVCLSFLFFHFSEKLVQSSVECGDVYPAFLPGGRGAAIFSKLGRMTIYMFLPSVTFGGGSQTLILFVFIVVGRA